jgi:hypothetical protein
MGISVSSWSTSEHAWAASPAAAEDGNDICITANKHTKCKGEYANNT